VDREPARTKIQGIELETIRRFAFDVPVVDGAAQFRFHEPLVADGTPRFVPMLLRVVAIRPPVKSATPMTRTAIKAMRRRYSTSPWPIEPIMKIRLDRQSAPSASDRSVSHTYNRTIDWISEVPPCLEA
jgi:hypothetical protein